jgi:hypothetical protein
LRIDPGNFEAQKFWLGQALGVTADGDLIEICWLVCMEKVPPGFRDM